MIDEYYDYCYGELEYRCLNFEFETLDIENYQGNVIINYNDAETHTHASLNTSTLKILIPTKQSSQENIQKHGFNVRKIIIL